jgi:hypothetical protein
MPTPADDDDIDAEELRRLSTPVTADTMDAFDTFDD